MFDRLTVVGRQVRVPCRSISGPVDAVPSDLLAHAHTVPREATANAVRHSHASELTIAISVGDDLVIDVTDDGVGIPDVPARCGTRNLRHRVREADGTFTINPADGRGTRLVWSAPLHRTRGPHPVS
jgi:signal transduction histidine kinase